MAKFWRNWHRSLSIIIVLPFLITITTGMFLLFRDRAHWINPQYPPASGELTIGFEQILKAAQSVPEMEVKQWADLTRIQVNPAKGSIVARSKNNYQIQVDGGSGEVVGGGVVRSSLLVSLHEGTFWFGKTGRYFIALPMALSLLFLSVSGTVLYFQPALLKKALRSKKQK